MTSSLVGSEMCIRDRIEGSGLPGTGGTAAGPPEGIVAGEKLVAYLKGRPSEQLGHGEFHYIEFIRLLGQQPHEVLPSDRNA
eukprot:11183886-Prorocentrum_lima.AAC.1